VRGYAGLSLWPDFEDAETSEGRDGGAGAKAAAAEVRAEGTKTERAELLPGFLEGLPGWTRSGYEAFVRKAMTFTGARWPCVKMRTMIYILQREGAKVETV